MKSLHHVMRGAKHARPMLSRTHLPPILAVVAGIATFSAMDAFIKGAAIATGVFTALLLRNLFGTVLVLPLWLASGRTLPKRTALKVHLQRSAVTAIMAALFFYGLVRIPMAEAIAISFIAPLIALYFAAVMLGETISPRAIAASLLGLAGVIVIGAGRFGSGGPTDREALMGSGAILLSALFYAMNLVLQRKQATLAGPVEIALVQNLGLTLIYGAFTPWLGQVPPTDALYLILAGAVLATAALLLLSWGYARAEAQVLVPIEYTGFLWAALFGWLMFGEQVGISTIAGATLIVLGCWTTARKPSEKRPEQTFV